MRFSANVSVHNLGVSDRAGVTRVCTGTDAHNTVGNQVGHLGYRRFRSGRAGRCVDVPITTLDALAGTGGADLLLIDAEGYDARIIVGARRLLESRRIDVLIFECCHLWKRAKLSPDAFGSLSPRGDRAPSQPLGSLAAAAERLGYVLILLGAEDARKVSGMGYDATELAQFARALCAREFTFCSFALVRATLARPLMRMHSLTTTRACKLHYVKHAWTVRVVEKH